MRKVSSLALFFLIFMVGCSNTEEPVTPTTPVKVEQKIEEEEYLRIVTSNKLLYHMVKDIVKDRHDVDYMMATEEEQWNFIFSEDSLKNIANKDIFIYFGAGFEPWVSEFVDKVNKDRVTIINSTRGIRLLTLNEPRKYGDIELRNNPYFWFDPNGYKIVLSNIKTAIQEKDPKQRDIYEEYFKEVIKNLDEMEQKLLDDLKQYKDYTFLTLSDDLDYFYNYGGIKPLKLTFEEDILKLVELLKEQSDNPKQLVLLYDDDARLVEYEALLSNSNIKRIKLNKYSTNKSIIEMMQENYELLRVVLIEPE
jgi:ABC-type Zn uptake system ZnuABC Zn-binding protein ZnuA